MMALQLGMAAGGERHADLCTLVIPFGTALLEWTVRYLSNTTLHSISHDILIRMMKEEIRLAEVVGEGKVMQLPKADHPRDGALHL
jgi:hypothetical protein